MSWRDKQNIDSKFMVLYTEKVIVKLIIKCHRSIKSHQSLRGLYVAFFVQKNKNTTPMKHQKEEKNMIAQAAKTWNVLQFVKMVEHGTITFSNIYQRSYVWDKDRE